MDHRIEGDATLPPTWEACKENVLPIKRGRSVKGLTTSLADPSMTTQALLASQEKVLEESVASDAIKDLTANEIQLLINDRLATVTDNLATVSPHTQNETIFDLIMLFFDSLNEKRQTILKKHRFGLLRRLRDV